MMKEKRVKLPDNEDFRKEVQEEVDFEDMAYRTIQQTNACECGEKYGTLKLGESEYRHCEKRQIG